MALEMQLILQMAADLFPKGFKFLRGDKKSKGRGRERSIADQVNLYVVMQGFIDGGNEVQAAASFVKDKFPDISKGNSVDFIKARFSEARKTVERINRGEITESESLELWARGISRQGVKCGQPPHRNARCISVWLGSPSVVDGDSLADIDVDHLNRG